MSDGRKNNKGTKGNKGGRPPKAEEQKVLETLQPYHPKAVKALEYGLDNNERWAVELFWKYYYGLPKQRTEITMDNEPFILKLNGVKQEAN